MWLKVKMSPSRNLFRANMIRYDSDLASSLRLVQPFGVTHSDPNTPANSSSFSKSSSADFPSMRPHSALAPLKHNSNQALSEDSTHSGFEKLNKRRVLSAPPARLIKRSASMTIIQPRQNNSDSPHFSVPLHRVNRFLQSSEGSFRSTSPSDRIRNEKAGNLLRNSFSSSVSRDDFDFDVDQLEVRSMLKSGAQLLRDD